MLLAAGAIAWVVWAAENYCLEGKLTFGDRFFDSGVAGGACAAGGGRGRVARAYVTWSLSLGCRRCFGALY